MKIKTIAGQGVAIAAVLSVPLALGTDLYQCAIRGWWVALGFHLIFAPLGILCGYADWLGFTP